MDAKLLEAYRTARYLTDDGLTLRVGERPAALGLRHWAFVTAANPRSKPMDPEENAAQNAKLEALLRALRLDYVKGRGVGEGWEEPSFLVLDVEREVAEALGRAFDQNAIVAGRNGGEAELVLLEST